MFDLRRFFRPANAPIAVPVVLSLLGMAVFQGGDRLALISLLSDRWSIAYLLVTPFLHGGLGHFLFNALALSFVGGQLLLPRLGAKYFIALMVLAACAGNIANNIFSDRPAIGLSAAIMGLLACSLYPYGRAPIKLLLIHDLFRRLPPFPLHYVAVFIVLLDIAGLIFDWQFFAHAAHLGGFACGLIAGRFLFRRFPNRRGRR